MVVIVVGRCLWGGAIVDGAGDDSSGDAGGDCGDGSRGKVEAQLLRLW